MVWMRQILACDTHEKIGFLDHNCYIFSLQQHICLYDLQTNRGHSFGTVNMPVGLMFKELVGDLSYEIEVVVLWRSLARRADC